MKTHINDADVCKWGCGVFMNITPNCKYQYLNNQNKINSNIDDNKVRVGECGAIDVILSAMKNHSNNADVCNNGCGVFWNIAVDDNIFSNIDCSSSK